MSNQILSQEEIDALLSSMDNGEVDVEPDEQKEVEIVVEPYDLMSKSTVLHDQFHALVEIYDRFTFLLQTSLSSTLYKPFEIEFVSTEMVRYGEFIAAFSSPVSLCTFKLEPLIGSGLLVVEPNLAFSLIECMFSGDGAPLPEIRDFTPIERRMMAKFAGIVLKNFEEAWDIAYPVKISPDLMETKPDFVHMAANEDLMIIVLFSVKWNDFSGNIHICIPYLMIEPIKEKLSSTYMMGKNMENAWRDRFFELLQETKVNVIGELGRNKYTVRDLLNFELNDVIGLDTGPDDTITIKVEGVTKYKGFPGVITGNRAVQLSTIIRENTGNSIYE
ncbi:MAG: flagellar motor switch protein FliM [Desulfosarcina sp.]|nr:flagellar motor switch protein FliM [Desulfobacterales bacterium]